MPRVLSVSPVIIYIRKLWMASPPWRGLIWFWGRGLWGEQNIKHQRRTKILRLWNCEGRLWDFSPELCWGLLTSFILGWILIYRNWSIPKFNELSFLAHSKLTEKFLDKYLPETANLCQARAGIWREFHCLPSVVHTDMGNRSPLCKLCQDTCKVVKTYYQLLS